MRNIFFDLDGTLINSLKRMYILFSELVPNNNFSYEKYWDIKKNGADQREVLTRYFNYQDEEIKKVHKKWLLMIENEKLLEIDQPYNDANFILKNLCKNNNLYIVTARQSTEKVRKQIERTKNKHIFLLRNHHPSPRVNNKTNSFLGKRLNQNRAAGSRTNFLSVTTFSLSLSLSRSLFD